MPDNDDYTLEDFLNEAPFVTEVMEHDASCTDEECINGENALAIITLNDWQAEFLADVMSMAVLYAEEKDKTVFEDNNEGGHQTLATVMAHRFHDYFRELSEVLTAVSEENDSERQLLAA